MVPTRRLDRVSRKFSVLKRAAGVLAAVLLVVSAVARADDAAIPRPADLERDVQFWIRVYSEISTNEGFLHDERNLSVVYAKLAFAPNATPRERQAAIDAERDRWIAVLRRLAAGGEPQDGDARRVREMWGAEGGPSRWLAAAREIRFQLGQSDRFRAGLERAGAWETHIAQTLANMGLPRQIAALPHVESSFNPAAYSKVGAAGLWQFMRSTGRRYLRIDSAVDERLDPFRATEAAAQLLAYNYRVLGSWPLALTAYNHGTAGMRRAKETIGTDDIVHIVRNHRSPSFGFASRNFYVSFLAALEIDRNPEKYFGSVARMAELQFHEIELPAYVRIDAIEKVTRLSRAELQSLNPALRPLVWSGQRLVPRGYRLRLPAASHREWSGELLAQRLTPAELFAGQTEPRSHRVRRGETLTSIASRYGITVRELAALNDLSSRAKLRSGRLLELPEAEPRLVARAAAPSAPGATPEPAARPPVYVVRRGDSLSQIAVRTGLAEAELLRINAIRNPNFIYEGQRLMLSAAPAAPVTAAAGDAPEAAPDAAEGGPIEPPVRQPTVAAVRRTVPPVAAPSPKTQLGGEPVSKAQAEALSPALAPGVAAVQSADSVDYGVARDGTVRVAAAETLGHYAEWLDVSAAQLRKLNGLRTGQPVLLGGRVKLDFSRVTREKFEEARRLYHSRLQSEFFAAHRIVGTDIYIIRRGDSLWSVAQRYTKLPVWLLQQYNPDVDLGEMRAGIEVVVPRVEEVATPVS